jgi:putative SOS response-associated peptidase YedK
MFWIETRIMCGRVRLPDDVRLIKEELKIRWDEHREPEKRYNVPPSLAINVVIWDRARAGRVLKPMRWGLIPANAMPDQFKGYSTANVRVEDFEQRKSYRPAWDAGRRCLIPIAHFFEWKSSEPQGKRSAYAVAMGNRETMVLAGLWEPRNARSPIDVDSFTVFTTDANGAIAAIHDRMPVILGSEDWAKWLGEEPASQAELKAMLKPFPAERTAVWPVDRRVGNVNNEDPALSELLRETAKPPELQGRLF